jgi:60 kDa SS-A/Ro ribonucleoprotein
MRYTAKDELSFERAAELKRVLEKIGRNEIDDDVLSSVGKYRFQLEELKHAINNALSADAKRELYTVLYKGLRYNALILNLAALERVFAVETKTVRKNGVKGTFIQEQVVKTEIPPDVEDMVAGKIRSVSDYRASNMLPFALISAQKMVTNEKFRAAIAEVLEACANEVLAVPKETDILLGVDISGSMDVMVNDSLSARDVAALFGALLKKSHDRTKVCGLSNDCYRLDFKGDGLFEMASEINVSGEHGGTYLGKLLSEYTGQKYVIILTDSETADDFEVVWKKKARIKGARLIVWQLQASHVKLSNDRSVVYIAGFSDRLLSLVKSIIEENRNMLEEIENLVL